MKKNFEKIIKLDPVITVLLTVTFAFVGLNLIGNEANAISELYNYVPAINIKVKDGTNEEVGYLVKKSNVKEALNSLNIALGDEDYTTIDENTMLEDGQTVEIHRITYSSESTTESIPFTTEYHTGNSSITGSRLAREGKEGTLQNNYTIRLDNGVEVSKELSSKEVLVPSVNKLIEYNTIGAGTTFTGRLTTYGSDCVGCSGRTSAGASLNANGVNNTGKATINYHGQEYYVLAADPQIPFCSIIEISNHKLGTSSTIRGIVLDRGGAIKGNKIDIYNGLENGRKFFSGSTSNSTQFKIISIGRGGAYCFKQ